MTPTFPHRWDLSYDEAITLQKALAAKVIKKGSPTVRLIAGIDCSVSKDVNIGLRQSLL